MNHMKAFSRAVSDEVRGNEVDHTSSPALPGYVPIWVIGLPLGTVACQWGFAMVVRGPAASATRVCVVRPVPFGRGVRKEIGVRLESTLRFNNAARGVRSTEGKR